MIVPVKENLIDDTNGGNVNRFSIKNSFLPDVEEETRKTIIDHNIRLINRILPFFTTMTTILLILYSILCVASLAKHLFALCCIAAFTGMFVCAFFLFKHLERDGPPSARKASPLLLNLTYWVFSIWGIIVSWQMYLRGNQMLLMDTVQIAFSLIVCCYPLYGVIRIAVSYLILFILLFCANGAAQINMAIYCLMAGMICFGTVLRYWMEVKNITQMRELARHARNLEHSSNHDELTGMKNRMALREDFPGYCKEPLWVIMADIDHFKRYNDTYGHEVGDQILKAVSYEMINHFGTDSCYRYGGDEFLIIQKDITRSEISTLLMVWSEAIHNIRLDTIPEEDDFSCSYGYTHGTAEDVEELRMMVVRADKKLYEMKRSPERLHR